jgi:predicted nucleic acid-binding protein
MLYFDSCYIVRLYLADAGWQQVRTLAATKKVACSLHGKVEVVAAFHRKFREGSLSQRQFSETLQQFESDTQALAFSWLPLSDNVLSRTTSQFGNLPATVQVRAADALHLACAKENSFTEIFSNDKLLLKAAPYFGLNPRNVFEHCSRAAISTA